LTFLRKKAAQTFTKDVQVPEAQFTKNKRNPAQFFSTLGLDFPNPRLLFAIHKRWTKVSGFFVWRVDSPKF
jgi:hypothetical protein